MAYVPNPADPTQPTDLIIAETAQAEFRALKAYIAGLALSAGGRSSPIRQTVLQGPIVAGISATIAASGTALGVDLKATSSGGLTTSFASGYTIVGPQDVNFVYSNDVANYWPGLVASNTSFLAVDYVDGVTNPTQVQTIAPPQYGVTYDNTRQGVLQFGGAAGSTIFLDDFGNTWTAQGGAKVQATQIKFGTGALGGAGAANALNGTTDFVRSSGIISLGNGGWSIRGWARATVLPGVGTVAAVMGGFNGANHGAIIGLNNTAGTLTWNYYISSDGATDNVASNVNGTSHPTANTDHFLELTYDFLAGVYRFYVDGVQENSTTSALRACEITGIDVGGHNAGGFVSLTGYIDKFEYLPYCQHPGGTTYAVPTAAPDVTAANYSSDWFDIVNYKMNKVTAASIAAGANPTFTSRNRLYIGEADTSGVAVTAVRPYAIAGKAILPYVTPWPAVGTLVSKQHNMGTELFKAMLDLQCLQVDTGGNLSPGDTLEIVHTAVAASNFVPIQLVKRNRNNSSFVVGSNTSLVGLQLSSGSEGTFNPGNFQYRIRAERLF